MRAGYEYDDSIPPPENFGKAIETLSAANGGKGVVILIDEYDAPVGHCLGDVAKAEVDLREMAKGGVSYSIDTVRAIAAENPGAELVFVVGEDSLPDLPKWRSYEELQTLCTFKAYPRTPESSTAIRRLFEANHVTLNPDAKLVKVVREGLVRKGGYCPCRLPKNPEFFCPCDEFKGQLADPSFHGLCHCRLSLKP